ncbi:MAG: TIGR02147 family protein [Bdellovibrionia bacterium]
MLSPMEPKTLLRETLEARRERNPGYSLRAFSRDLGVSAAALSQVMSGKRKFSLTNAISAAMALGLDTSQTDAFLSGFKIQRKTESPVYSRRLLKEDQFRLVADWYYFAIINLTKIRGCRSEPDWIAKRLGLDVRTVEDALDRLKRLSLIRVENGRLVRLVDIVRIDEEMVSHAIRLHHRQKFDLGSKALDEVEFAKREFISVTLPVNKLKVKELKRRLRSYKDTFAAVCRDDEATDVYHLGIQFFPLTK